VDGRRYPMSVTRQQAHEMIDRLPERQLTALVGLLESLLDPVEDALRNAPMDDEPETEGERSAVAEAREWFERSGGHGIPHAEAMRRLGLE
jgi:hypothetical protein